MSYILRAPTLFDLITGLSVSPSHKFLTALQSVLFISFSPFFANIFSPTPPHPVQTHTSPPLMAPVCGSYTRHLFIILVTSVICFLFLHLYVRYNDQGLLDSVIPMQDQQFSVSHFFNVNDRLTCVDPTSERGVEDTLCVVSMATNLHEFTVW